MSKKRIQTIVDAIKVPNEYLPVTLLQDWENRAKYEVNYIGKPMKFIYDKLQDTIVTFLPYEERKLEEDKTVGN